MIPERDLALRYEIEDASNHLMEQARVAAESIQCTDLKSAQVKGLLRQAQTGYSGRRWWARSQDEERFRHIESWLNKCSGDCYEYSCGKRCYY